MFRNRILLKSFAILFLLEIVSNVAWPTISYALTSGPTVPESTNFEPVDTTDMVNLFTGDMVYNTPVIEVPGPNGSYPMSLSYHAGIDPNLESSWVGLGWSLNAGSISRLVNGYADDHKDVEVDDHFYWSGNSQTTVTVGVTVPMRGGASVTAGLSFTNNSNTGFSVTPFAEAGMQIAPGLGIQASSLSGTANFTGPVTNLMGYVNMVENREITLNRDFGPISMEVKISSKGVKPKLTVGGMTKNAHREGKVNRVEEKSSGMIPIPTPIGIIAIGVSRTYVRTWINENATIKTNGSLYYPLTEPSSYTHMNGRAFDTYDLNSEDPIPGGDLDPEKRMDGSFTDYDSYTVNAQGVSGSIKPYHYYTYLYRQNKNNDGSPIIRSVPMGATGNNVEFRFINDFSNRFLFEPSTPVFSGTATDITFNTANITAGLNGQGYAANTLAGSKHIEFFTNHEIVNYFPTVVSQGFVDCTASGFTRSASTTEQMNYQIGGFKVTNESGMTYHFSLPVYSYNEYSYTEKIRDGNHTTYQEITKDGKYAYTWMLTAITGPDYVDRGGPSNAANGKVDPADYGYWVEFGYRQWTPDYIWRNPADGYQKDFDNNFQTYSHGKKEIYYLDYARTSTHIALFEKSTKLDGKSIGSTAGGFSNTSRTTARLDNAYLLDYTKFVGLGGFNMLNNFPSNKTNIANNAIRSVRFNYDYSLTPKTINSFDLATPTTKNGKLTLTSLEYLGKGGADILPSVQFGYELENPVQISVELEATGFDTEFTLLNSGFEVGDLVKVTRNTTVNYGLIEEISPAGLHKIDRISGQWMQMDEEIVTIQETKNPIFDKDMYDMWKYYKSDYSSTIDSRMTSPISEKSVDVWSLRQVKTMLGADINFEYESDYYEEVVLSGSGGSSASQHALRIKNVEKINEDQLKVFFFDDGYKMSDLFDVDEELDMNIIGAYKSTDLTETFSYPGCGCPSLGYAWHEDFEGSGIIKVINDNNSSLILDASYLINQMELSNVSTTDYNAHCAQSGDEPQSCGYSTQNWPSYIASGVAFAVNKPLYGGGIRVKQIEVANDGVSRRTNYTYKHGLTTYEPVSIPRYELNPEYEEDIPSTHLEGDYKEGAILQAVAISKKYSPLFNIAREVPGPAVTYKEVIVEGSVENEAGVHQDETYQQFKFQTFEYYMVKHKGNNLGSYGVGGSGQVSIAGINVERHAEKEATLDDMTTAIGNLKSSAVRDYKGNTLQSSTYDYLHDAYLSTLSNTGYTNYNTQLANKYLSQGLIVESFAEARIARNGEGDDADVIIGITSKRRTYPSVLTKVTHRNYKIGSESTNEIIAYDFFSGEDVKSIQKDGYGNTFLKEILPAYKSYSGMGLGMAGGKNMLTQVAGDFLYKVDPANTSTKLALVSANIQKWSASVPVLDVGAQASIWRKDKSYTWVGDDSVTPTAQGYYPIANYTEFASWSNSQTPPAQWQLTGKANLYDVSSHSLETENAIGIKSAARYNKKGLPSAIAGNSSYTEFDHFSVEDSQAAEWAPETVGYFSTLTVSASTNTAHTGQKSLYRTGLGLGGFRFNLPSSAPIKYGRYKVSAWVKSTVVSTAKLFVTIGAGQPFYVSIDPSKQSGDWYLLEHEFDFNGTNTIKIEGYNTANGAVYWDDMRFQSVDASVSAYVYNQWGELSHILDNNNLYTEYVYDQVGRLKESYKETFIRTEPGATYGNQGKVKVNSTTIHYGRSN